MQVCRDCLHESGGAFSGPREIVLGESRRGMQQWYEFLPLTESDHYLIEQQNRYPTFVHERRIHTTIRKYMTFRYSDSVVLDIFVTCHADKDDDDGESADCIIDTEDPSKVCFLIDQGNEILVKIIIRNRLQKSVEIAPILIESNGTVEHEKNAILHGDAGDFKTAMSRNVTHELSELQNANGDAWIVHIVSIGGIPCENIKFTLDFKVDSI